MELTSLTIKDRPKSLVQIAQDAIRRGIIQKELKLGQPLKEAALARPLQISNTPVREALSLLKAEGLVVSVPHKGYRVFTLNQEELVAFCELRFTLEAQALRYGIERNPKELVQKLHGILLKMQKNQDESMREEYLNLDTLFHISFFKACQNDFLLGHYQKINSMIETMRHYISISNEATQKSLESHQAIVNEIDQGRIPKAIELLEDHIVSWSKRSNIEFSKLNCLKTSQDLLNA